MQPEVKTDPVLATAGSAVATEQKDIEAHLHFSCAPISFLSVPGRTDHLAYILWYIFTWQ